VNISLVVVTDGTRLENLRRAVDSAKDLTQETVIVYQGNDTKAYEEIRKMSSFSVMTTPKGNADFDRNYAYGLATGEWVLSLDDDEHIPAETIKFIKRIINSKVDVVWFEFRNLVDGVDIVDILGPDPHPRLWRRRDGLIFWPDKAHTFPQINSPMQYFTKKPIIHDRKFDELFERHQKRVPSMDPQNVELETRFINALKTKLGKK